MTAALHVVAGVLRDARGRVLLAQRPPGKAHAGLWEFPGGKLEPGEEALAALSRELDEELGLEVLAARPLIAIPNGRILLDVWEVPDFGGRLQAREGQALAWIDPAAIDVTTMPPADRPVVTALRLPSTYLVTPAIETDDDAFVAGGGGRRPPGGGGGAQRVERALDEGVRLVQLRQPTIARTRIAALARRMQAACAARGARLLVHADFALAEVLGLDGVHLPARVARGLERRPLPAHRLVGVSCHDAAELAHAARIGADFATLSPLRATTSHPGVQPLGWDTARSLVAAAQLPVYVLGGLVRTDIASARALGAQGIAAIGGLWPDARAR
jgi:8-oxo-dGTP diphosphatase